MLKNQRGNYGLLFYLLDYTDDAAAQSQKKNSRGKNKKSLILNCDGCINMGC